MRVNLYPKKYPTKIGNVILVKMINGNQNGLTLFKETK